MSSRKIGLNLVVIVALAALFTGIWALYNRPVSVPDWPERISGFSFSPFRLNQNPQSGRYPSAEQMRTDLELVARHTPQHPHLFGPGRARRHPGAGRGVRPARQPGHLARPGPGQQRGRDRPRHPHRQRVAERGASDSRQRGAVPPRGDGGTVDRLPRPGPRGGQGSGDHRRTVARLPRTPGTGATRRPDRRPRPALLGGYAGGRRGGLRARTRARTQGRPSRGSRCCSPRSAGRATGACAAAPRRHPRTRPSTCGA
ncbi:glucosyl transferase [Pseudomonas aeruginosa]|nr:glucosyl transferase [Pseudomonas aeruginosa]